MPDECERPLQDFTAFHHQRFGGEGASAFSTEIRDFKKKGLKVNQTEKANVFAGMHKKGAPIVLYNIWDAGGAIALADAGAPAIATSSWSMAAAHGYSDGEQIPLELVTVIVSRICASVDIPVTVDFEGGYASDPSEIADNVRKVIRAGAVGINFEDRVVDGKGLYPIQEQVKRIEAIKAAAVEEGVPLFLNARTDLFLGPDAASHNGYIAEAKEREAAYAAAGADGFFVPGLSDPGLISEIVGAARLPVNVMRINGQNSVGEATKLEVSRVSCGPEPWFIALAELKSQFSKI